MYTTFKNTLKILIPLLISTGLLTAKSELSTLQDRLKQVDSQLASLASYHFQTNVGAIGYRSDSFKDSLHNEWVKLNFPKDEEIDQIVIIPCIWRDAKKGYQADGFPVSFKVLIGNTEYPEGKLIAEYSSQDQLLPRVAPLIIKMEKTQASWIKIIATELSSRAWDNQYSFQLAEVMVFSGDKNVALDSELTSSKNVQIYVGARDLRYLTDGSTPYIMDASGGSQSNSFLARIPNESTNQAKLTIDLGEVMELDRIHLHSLEVRDSVPQANRANFGAPKKLLISVSTSGDFSDSKTIHQYEQHSIYDVAPIMPFTFKKVSCRFIEITILEPDLEGKQESHFSHRFFGFAEIEAFSHGVNVLLGKRFNYNLPFYETPSDIKRLTDGHNMFGVILKQKEWMNQLALRHALERERPLLLKKISEKHLDRDSQNRLMLWIIGLLVLSAIAYYLINSHLQNQKVMRIRERFAADLHDELGANLHAISLLSEVAIDSVESNAPDEDTLSTMNEIHTTTKRSNEAIRYCINSQETRRPLNKIVKDMHRIARRMFDSKNYEIEAEGEDIVDALPLRKRHDFFLFYKECLVNISRHSRADSFQVKLIADARAIQLIVMDNGIGSTSTKPSSLQRRAKILKARLDIESPIVDSESGMKVHLTIPLQRFPYNLFSKKTSQIQKNL